jgi:hypothetical protein
MQPGKSDRIGLSKSLLLRKTPVKRTFVIVFLAFCFVFSMSPEAWAQSTWQQVPGPGDISRYGQAMATDTAANIVYLFGGRGNNGVSDELWKWDGENWLKIDPSGAWPPARFGHSMVYDSTNDELVVFGGKNDTTDFLDDMWVYKDGSWTVVSQQTVWPTGRHSFAMAHDSSSGDTYIYGGSTSADKHAKDMWRWTGASWETIAETADWPGRRYGHIMSFDSSANELVLFGGNKKENRGGPFDDNETWTWNGSAWTLETPANSPAGRHYAAMAFDASHNRVVLFGGESGSGNSGTIFDDAWMWDGSNWTTHSSTPSPVARYQHAMTYDPGSNGVILFGGTTSQGNNISNFLGDTWTFDGSKWRSIVSWPGARFGHATTYDGHQKKFYLFGGVSGNGANAETFNDLWQWDGSQWTQIEISGDWPAARHSHDLVYDFETQSLLLYGGKSGKGNDEVIFSDTWQYSGGVWQELTPTTNPGPRYGHSMAYHRQSRTTFLTAGRDKADLFDDTWRWNGSDWARISTATIPTARSGHAVVYDSNTKDLKLFGGTDVLGNLLSDTLTFDGSQWTQALNTGPTGRSDHDMAYDSLRGVTVLFSGNSASGANDTWELGNWDGTGFAWKEVFPTVSPDARQAHAMAFDRSRGRLVLFGGKSGQPDSETWLYKITNNPPEITLTCPTEIPETYSCKITATITDPDGDPITATLYYRSSATSNVWTAIPMTADGSTYSATIPESHVKKDQLEYYVMANDGVYLNTKSETCIVDVVEPYGSLTIDVNVNADWTITGTKRNGTAISPVNGTGDYTTTSFPAGSYQIEFKDYAGWDKPDPYKKNFTLGHLASVKVTGTYIQQFGKLTVTINPTAVHGFARWKAITSSGYDSGWKTSGTTLSLPVGTYTVQFNTVTNYTKPGDITNISITKDCNETLSGTYTQHTGNLKVTINPTAVHATARWKAINGSGYDSGWKTSGTTLPLPVGTYTVQFNAVANYTKPGDITNISITKDCNETRTGTYTQHTGNLKVTINPTAVHATARWKAINGSGFDSGWKTSGTTLPLPVGTYTVQFNTVTNYTKPGDITNISITKDCNETRSGTYTQHTGNLTVTINPTAVRATARWKAITGSGYDSGWKTSGTTLPLPVGTYTVQFNTVAGYNKPGDISNIGITNGSNINRTGTYTQSAGNLTVTILPTAVRTNARWKAVNSSGYDSGWKTSGTTISLSAGTYTVQFNTVSGYTKPANIGNISITGGGNETRTGTYTRDKGYLKVYIEPDAVRASARWCVNGTCYAHGKTITLPTGTYTITFTDVAGFNKPASITATVSKGQTTVKTGTYTQQMGNLKIYINPDAVRGTARWCVNGQCYTHGTTVTLPVGNYTVTFTDVAGYSKPASLSVKIAYNQLITKTVTYTQLTGYLKVNLTPTLAVSGGARWKAVNGSGFDSGWKTSGTTISVLAGNYTVIFMKLDFDCWFHKFPADQTATVTVGNTTTLTGEYMRVGSIVVVLDPFYAAEGGTWRQIRPGLPTYEDWHPTNYKDLWEPIDDWRYNPYQIEYHDLPGWPDLAIDKVPLTWCETVVYKQRLEDGYLQCFISPNNIGAKWYIYPDTSRLYNHGDRIRVKPAQYRIGVMPVSGYITPVNEYVKVYPTCTTTHEFRFFETMTMAGSDFDGDGKANLSVFRPDSGEWLVEGQNPVNFGGKNDKPVPGDYNGDGNLDIAFFREANGMWFLHGMGNVKLGQPGDIPVPADYNGDGTTDIAVFRPSEGKWIFQSGGELSFGVQDDIPVPADYDGDGQADVAVYRPNEGKWYLMVPQYDNPELTFDGPSLNAPISEPFRNAPLDPANPRPDISTLITTITMGGAGMLPIPADYNGDGKVDAAMYDPQTGSWWLNGEIFAQFGQPGDIPVPGDYNGDGKTDIAVFSPDKGKWIVKGLFETPFGQPGDIPLVQGK